MSSRVLKFTAGAGTNLTPVGPAERATLTGYEIYNTAAAARFVKIYWGPPGSFSGGGNVPVVGTDVPAITIGLPTVSQAHVSFTSPVCASIGTMFVATTVNGADSDATAVTAGDLIVSIFWE